MKTHSKPTPNPRYPLIPLPVAVVFLPRDRRRQAGAAGPGGISTGMPCPFPPAFGNGKGWLRRLIPHLLGRFPDPRPAKGGRQAAQPPVRPGWGMACLFLAPPYPESVRIGITGILYM